VSGDSMGDKIKGVAKEAGGKITGDDSMEREGEAQQKKAQKQDEAERLEDAAAEKKAAARDEKVEEKRHS